jgi:hypothetical protein
MITNPLASKFKKKKKNPWLSALKTILIPGEGLV